MAGWVLAGIYLLVVYNINKKWRASHPQQYTYDPVRKWRTSRGKLFLKAWLLIFVPPALVVTFLVGGNLFNAILGAFLGAAVFAAFMMVMGRLLLGWWYGNDPTYSSLRRDGWDPFWDTWCMGLINNDPEEVRAGQPPKGMQSFTPPTNWSVKCPNCGAAQPGPIFWCHQCGLGYENGCEKTTCPDCNTTFVESEPGKGRTMAVTCPGCGKAWFMPSYHHRNG